MEAMARRDPEVTELRRALRRVLRGLWRRRRLPDELLHHLSPTGPPVGPRHIALLVHVGTEGERTVGELARELGLSLPAASKLARDLEQHALVHRREAIEDKRRTVVHLNGLTSRDVESWLARRDAPLRATLAALDDAERAAFLKGLATLADQLMRESPRGPVRSHHQAAHRGRADRDRPV
jgi:DNA-binding MarR family transcriptional regulator